MWGCRIFHWFFWDAFSSGHNCKIGKIISLKSHSVLKTTEKSDLICVTSKVTEITEMTRFSFCGKRNALDWLDEFNQWQGNGNDMIFLCAISLWLKKEKLHDLAKISFGWTHSFSHLPKTNQLCFSCQIDKTTMKVNL